MEKKMPRVCVGMPVFNGENYIAEAIESFLNQTYEDFELVISDNCSTDRTEEICKAFAARDSRVRYHRNDKNIGASRNYNGLFEWASGPYFKWAAHDDVCEPTYLERCVAVLDGDESVVLCHTQTKLIDGQGHVITIPPGWRGRIEDSQNNLIHAGVDDPMRKLDSARVSERFHSVVIQTRMVHEIFGVMRVEALRETPLMRSFYGSDKVLLAELSVKGRFKIVPEPLFCNRRHPTQSSQPSPRQREIWNNPLAQSHHFFPRWLCFKGYFSAATSGEMSLGERMECYGSLVQYVTTPQRWRGVIREMTRAVAL
jgi:glycosyltransferase involved in cell wall biosynthesis